MFSAAANSGLKKSEDCSKAPDSIKAVFSHFMSEKYSDGWKTVDSISYKKYLDENMGSLTTFGANFLHLAVFYFETKPSLDVKLVCIEIISKIVLFITEAEVNELAETNFRKYERVIRMFFSFDGIKKLSKEQNNPLTLIYKKFVEVLALLKFKYNSFSTGAIVENVFRRNGVYNILQGKRVRSSASLYLLNQRNNKTENDFQLPETLIFENYFNKSPLPNLSRKRKLPKFEKRLIADFYEEETEKFAQVWQILEAFSEAVEASSGKAEVTVAALVKNSFVVSFFESLASKEIHDFHELITYRLYYLFEADINPSVHTSSSGSTSNKNRSVELLRSLYVYYVLKEAWSESEKSISKLESSQNNLSDIHYLHESMTLNFHPSNKTLSFLTKHFGLEKYHPSVIEEFKKFSMKVSTEPLVEKSTVTEVLWKSFKSHLETKYNSLDRDNFFATNTASNETVIGGDKYASIDDLKVGDEVLLGHSFRYNPFSFFASQGGSLYNKGRCKRLKKRKSSVVSDGSIFCDIIEGKYSYVVPSNGKKINFQKNTGKIKGIILEKVTLHPELGVVGDSHLCHNKFNMLKNIQNKEFNGLIVLFFDTLGGATTQVVRYGFKGCFDVLVVSPKLENKTPPQADLWCLAGAVNSVYKPTQFNVNSTVFTRNVLQYELNSPRVLDIDTLCLQPSFIVANKALFMDRCKTLLSKVEIGALLFVLSLKDLESGVSTFRKLVVMKKLYSYSNSRSTISRSKVNQNQRANMFSVVVLHPLGEPNTSDVLLTVGENLEAELTEYFGESILVDELFVQKVQEGKMFTLKEVEKVDLSDSIYTKLKNLIFGDQHLKPLNLGKIYNSIDFTDIDSPEELRRSFRGFPLRRDEVKELSVGQRVYVLFNIDTLRKDYRPGRSALYNLGRNRETARELIKKRYRKRKKSKKKKKDQEALPSLGFVFVSCHIIPPQVLSSVVYGRRNQETEEKTSYYDEGSMALTIEERAEGAKEVFEYDLEVDLFGTTLRRVGSDFITTKIHDRIDSFRLTWPKEEAIPESCTFRELEPNLVHQTLSKALETSCDLLVKNSLSYMEDTELMSADDMSSTLSYSSPNNVERLSFLNVGLPDDYRFADPFAPAMDFTKQDLSDEAFLKAIQQKEKTPRKSSTSVKWPIELGLNFYEQTDNSSCTIFKAVYEGLETRNSISSYFTKSGVDIEFELQLDSLLLKEFLIQLQLGSRIYSLSGSCRLLKCTRNDSCESPDLEQIIAGHAENYEADTVYSDEDGYGELSDDEDEVTLRRNSRELERALEEMEDASLEDDYRELLLRRRSSANHHTSTVDILQKIERDEFRTVHHEVRNLFVQELDSAPVCQGLTNFPSISLQQCILSQTGKYYFELEIVKHGLAQVGVAMLPFEGDTNEGCGVGDDMFSFAIDIWRKKLWAKTSTSATANSASRKRFFQLVEYDVLGFIIEINAEKQWFSLDIVKNGVFTERFKVFHKVNYVGPGIKPVVTFNKSFKGKIRLGHSSFRDSTSELLNRKINSEVFTILKNNFDIFGTLFKPSSKSGIKFIGDVIDVERAIWTIERILDLKQEQEQSKERCYNSIFAKGKKHTIKFLQLLSALQPNLEHAFDVGSIFSEPPIDTHYFLRKFANPFLLATEVTPIYAESEEDLECYRTILPFNVREVMFHLRVKGKQLALNALQCFINKRLEAQRSSGHHLIARSDSRQLHIIPQRTASVVSSNGIPVRSHHFYEDLRIPLERKRRVIVSREDSLKSLILFLLACKTGNESSPQYTAFGKSITFESLGKLMVQFQGEAGYGLGPTTEFFSNTSAQIINPDSEVIVKGFRGTDNQNAKIHLFPEPLDDKNQSYFWVATGRLLGLSLRKKLSVDLPISETFLYLLQSTKNERSRFIRVLLSLRTLDPILWQSLKYLYSLLIRKKELGKKIHGSKKKDRKALKKEIKNLCLSFRYDTKSREYRLGDTQHLKGKDPEPVTVNNLEEYLQSLVSEVFIHSVEENLHVVRKNIDLVLQTGKRKTRHSPLSLFTVAELRLVFTNSSSPDLLSWKFDEVQRNIIPKHGYKRDSPEILDLVDVLVNLSPRDKQLFLKFITGTNRLPPGGWDQINPKLTVVKRTVGEGEGMPLPSCGTCLVYLKLPSYGSKSILRSKLLQAIQEGQDYFALD
eukprot:augustus_masked-scaffold_11-processed-gene-12.82-mRNA-1 protein AED:0.48 eAED:0.48 QI:0/-1/0/1/-1/1/1/0/2156